MANPNFQENKNVILRLLALAVRAACCDAGACPGA
jgi:hypothetical protein